MLHRCHNNLQKYGRHHLLAASKPLERCSKINKNSIHLSSHYRGETLSKVFAKENNSSGGKKSFNWSIAQQREPFLLGLPRSLCHELLRRLRFDERKFETIFALFEEIEKEMNEEKATREGEFSREVFQ